MESKNNIFYAARESSRRALPLDFLPIVQVAVYDEPISESKILSEFKGSLYHRLRYGRNAVPGI